MTVPSTVDAKDEMGRAGKFLLFSDQDKPPSEVPQIPPVAEPASQVLLAGSPATFSSALVRPGTFPGPRSTQAKTPFDLVLPPKLLFLAVACSLARRSSLHL